MTSPTYGVAVVKVLNLRYFSKPSIRIAKNMDIFCIRDCNLKNLPENYALDFYEDQLSSWPALSIVAVDDKSKIVGYILGRLDMTSNLFKDNFSGDEISQPNVAFIGHVVSMAVNSNERGKGLAAELMHRLHNQFIDIYNIDSVYLHCRISNIGAVNLYSEKFSYLKKHQVPSYYGDGEAAWFMTIKGLRRNLKGYNDQDDKEKS